jgi:hypothetical protein
MLIEALMLIILDPRGCLVCREQLCHVWKFEDQIKLHY